MKWFEKIEVSFTDTDLLLHRIESQDVYKVMNKHADLFDFFDYPYEHFCCDKKNRKVLGKFKDKLLSLTLNVFIHWFKNKVLFSVILR